MGDVFGFAARAKRTDDWLEGKLDTWIDPRPFYGCVVFRDFEAPPPTKKKRHRFSSWFPWKTIQEGHPQDRDTAVFPKLDRHFGSVWSAWVWLHSPPREEQFRL